MGNLQNMCGVHTESIFNRCFVCHEDEGKTVMLVWPTYNKVENSPWNVYCTEHLVTRFQSSNFKLILF